MIKLYHGSNVSIDEIDLKRSRRGKDFGCGFYLNANKQQAESMAVRTTEREKTGVPTISTFLFDEQCLESNAGLNVKMFDDYTVEWAEFVIANRKHKGEGNTEGYDIVVGPIANDTVGVQIDRFKLGYISIETLIEELRYRGNRAVQYYFGTEKAISLLTKIER